MHTTAQNPFLQRRCEDETLGGTRGEDQQSDAKKKRKKNTNRYNFSIYYKTWREEKLSICCVGGLLVVKATYSSVIVNVLSWH